MHNLSLTIGSEVILDSSHCLCHSCLTSQSYVMSTSVRGQMLPTAFLHGHCSVSSILSVGLTSNWPRDFLTLEGLEVTSSALLALPGSSRLPCKHAVLLDPAEAVLLLVPASSMLSSPSHTGSTLGLHKYFSELYRLRVIIPTQRPICFLSTLHDLRFLNRARLDTERRLTDLLW